MYGVYEEKIEFQSPLSGVYLRDVLSKKSQTMRATLEQEARGVVQRNADEGAYIASVVSKFSIALPRLNFDPTHMKKAEEYKDMPASHFAEEVFFSRIGQIRVWIVTFGIPYSGNIALIKYVPASGAELRTHEFTLKDGYLWFSVQTRDTANKDIDAIKRERDSKITVLQQRVEAIVPEIEAYNRGLESSVTGLFANLKKKYLDDQNTLSQL